MQRVLIVVCSGVLGIVLLANSGSSQDAKKETKEPGKMKGMLPPNWKSLKLTDEQRRKVYDIHNQYKAKIDKLTKEIHELRMEEKTETAQVLTDEQKTHLRKLTLGEDKKGTEKEKTPAEKKPAD